MRRFKLATYPAWLISRLAGKIAALRLTGVMPYRVGPFASDVVANITNPDRNVLACLMPLAPHLQCDSSNVGFNTAITR